MHCRCAGLVFVCVGVDISDRLGVLAAPGYLADMLGLVFRLVKFRF